jgi:hypothetical protein
LFVVTVIYIFHQNFKYSGQYKSGYSVFLFSIMARSVFLLFISEHFVCLFGVFTQYMVRSVFLLFISVNSRWIFGVFAKLSFKRGKIGVNGDQIWNLRAKLYRDQYKTQNRKIWIFGVLFLHGRWPFLMSFD